MRPVLKGSVDQSVVIRIVDSGDGTPETGVVAATSGLDLKYRREGAATANLTEADLSALTDAHADGGLLHIGSGYYRVDLPDAAVATGANGVLVFGTVTGMVVIGCYVPLVDFNPYDAVRLGLTSLPNAAAEASGGLYTRGSGAGQLSQSANGELGIATLTKTLTTYTGDTPQTGDSFARIGAPAGASISVDVASVKTDAGTLLSRLSALRAGYLDNLSAGAVALEASLQGLITTVGASAAGIATAVWGAGARTLSAFGFNVTVGTNSDKTGYELTSAYDPAKTASTQTSVDDLPTNAELWIALGTADDATLAAIAALIIPTAAQNAAALMDLSNGVETGLTPRQAMRLMVAALAGKLSGGGTTTIVIRNAIADDKNRITATVDASENRTAVVVDLT